MATANKMSDRVRRPTTGVIAFAFLAVGMALSANATGQVRELLEDLLGGQKGEVESLEVTFEDSNSVTLMATFSEVEDSADVSLVANVLDTRLRRIRGFYADPVALEGTDGSQGILIEYNGVDAATSASVEVRLERSGRVIDQRLHALVKTWGEDGSGGGNELAASQAGGASDQTVSEMVEREPQIFEIDPVPMGDTPTGAISDTDVPTGETPSGSDVVIIADPIRLPPGRVIIPSQLTKRPRRVALYSWWGGSNEDHLCTTDPAWAGASGRTKGGYRFYRLEGQIYAPDGPQPADTVPLYRWWNSSRGDHFTTTNPAWRGVAGQVRNGYRFMRLEGYLPKSPTGGLALKSYWSASREDNVATGDPAWRQEQRRAPDYREYRVEGYLLK